MSRLLGPVLQGVVLVGAAAGCAVAQTASYEVFGNQCQGTGKTCGPIVAEINANAGHLSDMVGIPSRDYAVAMTAAADGRVCGARFFTHSRWNDPRIVSMGLCRDDKGLPGAAIGAATMLVGAQPIPKWYKATFASPIDVRKGETYWLTFRNPNPSINLPVSTAGVTVSHAFRDGSSAPWSPSTAAPMAWAVCMDGVDTGSQHCLGAMASANCEAPLADSMLPASMDFAIPFDATGKGGHVCGLWMVTNSRGAPGPVPVTSHLWLDDGGKPGELVRSGTFMIDTPTALYRSYWSGYPIVRGQRFWFGWSNPASSITANIAATGEARGYAMRLSTGGEWAIAATPLRWNYLVKMTDETGDEPATLTVAGPPRLGEVFEIRLSFAPPQTLAMLWSGSSRHSWATVPLPFAFPGTYGCLIQVAYDGFALAALSDSLGAAAISLPIPGSPSLAGLELYQQWVVSDALANARGATFSNGGHAVLGY